MGQLNLASFGRKAFLSPYRGYSKATCFAGGFFTNPYGVYNILTEIATNHYELRFPDDTVYVYDIPQGTTSDQAFLVEILDAYGQALTFGYNSEVLLTTITDAMGLVTTLTYNSVKLVTQVTDPFGRSATFEYDSNRDLIKITDMGGYWTNFSYDADVYLTGIENDRGRWGFYFEPADGSSSNWAKYPAPDGTMWENYRMTVTNPSGEKEEYYFCSYYNRSWYVSPGNYKNYVDFDNNNYGTQSTEFTENVPMTIYDLNIKNRPGAGLIGELSKITYPEGDSVSFGYDSAASESQFIWAPEGQGDNTTGTGGYAGYKVNIAKEGEYVLWGRVLAPTGSDDSFFVKVGSSTNEAWSVAGGSGWIWDMVNIEGGADPVKYYLTTGEQTIKIGQREDGTKLDKLLLTNDMSYVPTDIGENSLPIAYIDSDTTDEDTPVTIDVLLNDLDSDGTINPATVVVVNNPVYGAAVHNGDGTVTYTPDTGYKGADAFTYRVEDDSGTMSNEATVTITVNGAAGNLPPIAVDDNVTTDADTPVTINVADNDTDADGTIMPATVTLMSNPANGTVVHNGDGTVTYTPNTGYTGVDVFTYSVNDNRGSTSNEATVTVTVTNTGDPDRYYWLEAEAAESITSPMQIANDGDGNRTAITDSHSPSHTTFFTYNNSGSVTSVADAKNNVTNLIYAANEFDLLEIKKTGLPPRKMTYNNAHDLTSVTDRLNNKTTITYNSLGQITSIKEADGTLNIISNYTYNSSKQLEQVSRDGMPIYSFTYDPIGRVKTSRDATGLILIYDYNDLNNVTKITYPDGKFVSYEYSGCCPHMIDTITDRAGSTISYTYDALKHLTEVVDTGGRVTRFVYDVDGNMIKLIDANGKVTTFEYDLNDRLVKKIYDDGKSISFTYDSSGLLDTRTNARGIVTDYAYDENHNLDTTTYSDTTPGVTYVYDNFNRVTTRQDGIGAYVYGYNDNSRLTNVDGPWETDTLTYQYDALGRRKSLIPQGGQTVTYTYDSLNRLTDIQAGTDTFSYSYTGANPIVQSMARPNGSTTSYQYDILNRLTQVSNKDSSAAIINQYTYTYNPQDDRSGEVITNGNRITSFQNQLINYDHNSVNQLLTSTNRNKVFTYDADGNMTRGYTPDGHVFTADYDAGNRLGSVEYTDSGGVIRKTEYRYSGDGLLAETNKFNDGISVGSYRFVRDGFLTIQEEINAFLVYEFTWGINMGGGIGGLLNMKDNFSLDYSCLYDGEGNVTAMLDGTQSVAATYTYDAFGNLMSKTGNRYQPFRFSTKHYDEDTGLLYYGYRFYSPAIKRWMTRDPLGEAGGINLYGFVSNNPVNYVDPYGLKGSKMLCEIGKVDIGTLLNPELKIRSTKEYDPSKEISKEDHLKSFYDPDPTTGFAGSPNPKKYKGEQPTEIMLRWVYPFSF